MKDYIFDVNKLHFRWSKKSDYILKDISFKIKREAFTVIIGQNGSGKTTLLKLLAKFMPATSGTIIFGENELNSIPQKKYAEDVAYVAQNPNEKIPITVEEVVNLGNFPNQTFFHINDGLLHERVISALEATNTIGLKDRIFTSLSGGEKQKIMIARALCQNTSVILLDEPTSSLDIKNKVEIMKLLRSFVDQKKISIVLVSHDLNLISEFADDIIFLYDNKFINDTKNNIMKPEILEKGFKTKIKMISNESKNLFFY